MNYGVVLPGGTAVQQIEQAVLAEQSGWDGVFVWEGAYAIDAWALLSAMAVRTKHVRLGTLLTPLPWRRPWKVAGQVATLDQISNGRAILAVGVGALDPALPATGEVEDLRERAGRMDEEIDLIRALWAGETSWHGQYYNYEGGQGGPSAAVRPVQERPPIWVVGVWPRPRSMRRILRCDGIIPQFDLGEREATPADVRTLRAWLAGRDARPDIDVTHEGETPSDDRDAATAIVAPWVEAGCTWWLETRWAMPHETNERMREVEQRIAAGPPR